MAHLVRPRMFWPLVLIFLSTVGLIVSDSSLLNHINRPGRAETPRASSQSTSNPSAFPSRSGSTPPIPKQTITGDTSVAAGEFALLGLSQIDNASAPGLRATAYSWRVQEADLTERKLHVDADGTMIFGTGTQPRTLKVMCAVAYVFLPNGAVDPSVVVTILKTDVTVTAHPGPVPPSPPAPSPGPSPSPPLPQPPEPPGPDGGLPVPMSIRLYAVAVYSGDPSKRDERAFAAVRDSAKIPGAAEKFNIGWRAWQVDNPEIDARKIRPHLTGKMPELLIYDSHGNVYKMANPRSLLSEADLIEEFARLRGPLQ